MRLEYRIKGFDGGDFGWLEHFLKKFFFDF